MAEDTKRHVKVTGSASHRTGELRSAVKPHKRTTTPDVQQLITTFMGSVKAGSLTQTYWGNTITKNAATLRSNFGLAATDDPYLLLDASGGRGQAGMLLSKTGVHFSNGRGSVARITWAELPKQTISYTRGMLAVGQTGIVSTDGKTLVTLLQQIQGTLTR